MKTKKKCVVCSKLFIPAHSHNIACSRTCGVVVRSGPTKKNAGQVPCENCGKTLTIKQSKLEKEKYHYCSRYCRGQHIRIVYLGSKNPNYKRKGIRICVGCGSRYKSYNKTRKYCSPECSYLRASEETMANLRRGTEAERRAKIELIAMGYTVMRSAASKGPYDLIAFNRKHILFIQVKRTKDRSRRFQPKDMEELRRATAPKTPFTHKEMWCWIDKEGWLKKRLSPMEWIDDPVPTVIEAVEPICEEQPTCEPIYEE